MSSVEEDELEDAPSTMDPREAFLSQDPAASKLAHDLKNAAQAGEQHMTHGKFVKPIVYGALDGITTTFAVVAAVVGGGLPISTILIMGFANLLADGLAMGLGDFLSGQAENEYVQKEYARERWETQNYLEGEQSEMIELYESKGMTREDATTIVMTMSKYTDIFVDTMMVEELGLLPPEQDKWEPLRSGAVTFASFCAFGAVPLIFYVITAAITSVSAQDLSTPTFILATIMTGITLFILGVVKTRFTSEAWWRGGLMMFLNGSAAAFMSFIVSILVAAIAPAETCPAS